MKEIWKPVVGFEGRYEVSDQGRVRSISRTVAYRNGRDRRIKERLRATVVRPDGYEQVNLSANNKVQIEYVHRLVAAAFLGPCPAGMEVCHNSGARADNRSSNLRYDTRVNNQADRKRHGTALVGEQVAGAILTAEKVRAIRASKLSRKVAAGVYGVSAGAIKAIRTGRTWAHV